MDFKTVLAIGPLFGSLSLLGTAPPPKIVDFAKRLQGSWFDILKTVNATFTFEEGLLAWYAYVVQKAPIESFESVRPLFEKHARWPGMDQLQVRFEKCFAEWEDAGTLDGARVLEFYKNRFPQTTEGWTRWKCAIAGSERKDLWPRFDQGIKAFWVSSAMNHTEEQRFLKDYALNVQAVQIQRLEHLVSKGRFPQAWNLAPLCDAEWCTFLWDMQAFCHGKIEHFSGKTPEQKTIAAFVQAQRAVEHKHFERAASLLTGVHPKDHLFQKTWAKLAFKTARGLLLIKPQAAYALVNGLDLINLDDRMAKEGFAGWISLTFLKNPQQALKHLLKAAQSHDSKISSRAFFYAGRIYADLGESAKSLSCFQDASRFTETFFGQWASVCLKKEACSKESIRAVTADSVLLPDFALADLKAAERLASVSDPQAENAARRFVFSFAKNPTFFRDYSVPLLSTASKISGPSVVRTAQILDSAGGSLGVPFREAYPLIDDALSPLVRAIIREESGGDSKAHNPTTRAYGLMQVTRAVLAVLPQFADFFSKKDAWQDPDSNIAVGVTYLRYLRDFFHNEPFPLPLMVAAYNAGPKRVHEWKREWEKKRPLKTMDDVVNFLHWIPNDRTRVYVFNVLKSADVYKALTESAPASNPSVPFWAKASEIFRPVPSKPAL